MVTRFAGLQADAKLHAANKRACAESACGEIVARMEFERKVLEHSLWHGDVGTQPSAFVRES